MKLFSIITLLATIVFQLSPVQASTRIPLRQFGWNANQAFIFEELQSEHLELLRETRHHGLINRRYRQLHKGIPIWGEHIIIETEVETGRIARMHGQLITDIKLNLSKEYPELSTDEALGGKKRELLSRAGQRGWYFDNEKSELIIFPDDTGKTHLAYFVSFFADLISGGQPTRPVYIIDAVSGKTLLQYEALAHVEAGTGPGGNNKTGQYEYGTDFGYLDVTILENQFNNCSFSMENDCVKTVDLENGTQGSDAFVFCGPRNDHKPINGAYCPINDAHACATSLCDMYTSWVGEPPVDFQLQMRVHYSTNYENAFWDGSSMSIGDGASTFYPLVSADVISHEASHGFTEKNSDLIYINQSGAINESFSDLAGEALEFYMKGVNDWMVGYDIFKGSAALRYMQNPPQDGHSIDSAIDYIEGMSVHYSSGVFNKAFYLLANKPNWNTQLVFQVMALANQNYWSPSSDFYDAAQGAADAALVLGLNSDDVEDAFAAVDVIAPPVCGLNTITTDGLSVGRRTWKFYTYDLLVSGCLIIKTSGGSGDVDLYTRLGSRPTSSIYDCRPYLNGNSETCTYEFAPTGTYHIGLYGYSRVRNVALEIIF